MYVKEVLKYLLPRNMYFFSVTGMKLEVQCLAELVCEDYFEFDTVILGKSYVIFIFETKYLIIYVTFISVMIL